VTLIEHTSIAASAHDRLWPIATFRGNAANGRFRGIADIGRGDRKASWTGQARDARLILPARGRGPKCGVNLLS
jgi:hypothetical protein